MKQVTIKNTNTYSGMKCELCKRVGKKGEEMFVFGTGNSGGYYRQGYVVHRSCMEILILGSEDKVMDFKAIRAQKIDDQFEEMRKKLLEQYDGVEIVEGSEIILPGADQVATKPRKTRKVPARPVSAQRRARNRPTP